MTEITDLSSPVLWLIVGLLWGSMLAVIIREHWSRTRDAIERERWSDDHRRLTEKEEAPSRASG